MRSAPIADYRRGSTRVSFQPADRLLLDARLVAGLPADSSDRLIDRLAIGWAQVRLSVSVELRHERRVAALLGQLTDEAGPAGAVDQRIDLRQMRQDEIEREGRVLSRGRPDHSGAYRLPRLVGQREVERAPGQ